MFALMAAAAAQPSAAAKPKVPAGTDPGGVAVGLIGPGVDYTDAEIAPRLARDGEGELVGWDFVDGDNRPYASAAAQDQRADGGATGLAKLLLSAYSGARLVPVRVKRDDPDSIAGAVRFLVQTPARVVAVPLAADRPQDWHVLYRVAGMAGQITFVLPTSADAAADLAAPDNVLRVAPAGSARGAAPQSLDAWVVPRGSTMFGARAGAPPSTAAEAVALGASFAACAYHRRPAHAGRLSKSELLDLAAAATGGADPRTIDPLCLYGGRRF
jgi:hypothetical protein